MVSLLTNKFLPACVHVSNEHGAVELISEPRGQPFDPHPLKPQSLFAWKHR